MRLTDEQYFAKYTVVTIRDLARELGSEAELAEAYLNGELGDRIADHIEHFANNRMVLISLCRIMFQIRLLRNEVEDLRNEPPRGYERP